MLDQINAVLIFSAIFLNKSFFLKKKIKISEKCLKEYD